ncbi:MAG: PAS domain S-box-containing protein [Saprospiraceae bacterium]|jgi:PAS domain S-box-containing protein
MNRLLKRQIKRYFNGLENIPEEMLPFIKAIEYSYNHYEEDRLLLERAIDISSEELVEANQQLRREAKAQKTILLKLKSSMNTVLSIYPTEENLKIGNDEDILEIVTILESQLKTIKEYEESLTLIKHFIDQSTDAIEVADESGKIFFVNQKAANLLGIPVNNLIGSNIYDLNDKMRSKKDWERICQSLKTNKELIFKRLQKFKNQEPRLMESILNKIIINDKVYIIGVSRDITARQEAEKEKEELIEKLRAMNEELEDFAHIVSHDLKAPLRGIKTIGSWLLMDHLNNLDEDGKELVQLLDRRVERMYSLIEGILQYSKVGHNNSETQILDIKQVINEIIDDLEKPAHFSINITSNLPIITNDGTQIRQVFQNFITNAIKYNDKEKGLVEISCKDLETHWEFCISDNGPGIQPKYHEKIFQIFQTLQKRDDFESTGIGLTIVSKIIKNNFGEIRIDSAQGKGAKFYFTIKKKE